MATETTQATAPAETEVKEETVVVESTATAGVKAETTQQAPANLFSKASESAAASVSNPTRVKVILAQIDDYVKSNGNNLSDADAARNGAIGLFQAVKLLVTLTGGDLTKVADYLVKAIASNKVEAFAETFIFRHINALGTAQERDNFARIMNLFVQFATLSNRANIRKFANIDYSLALIANSLTRKQLNAYFPK